MRNSDIFCGKIGEFCVSMLKTIEAMAKFGLKSVSAEVSCDGFVGFQARNCEIGLVVHRAVEGAESRKYAQETIAHHARRL